MPDFKIISTEKIDPDQHCACSDCKGYNVRIQRRDGRIADLIWSESTMMMYNFLFKYNTEPSQPLFEKELIAIVEKARLEAIIDEQMNSQELL